MGEGEPGDEAGGGKECVAEDFELEFAREAGKLWECRAGFHRDFSLSITVTVSFCHG